MSECGFKQFDNKCGLQVAGKHTYPCNGKEVCPIYRIVIALERISENQPVPDNFFRG